MFWGLIMEPQRRYTQQVKKAFHISMASLDVSTSSDEPAQIMCGFEGRNYLLCTLKKSETVQCPLDLNFEVGSEVSFAANGKGHVHLTGYLLKEELDDMLDEVEEEEPEEETTVKTRKRNRKKEGNSSPAKKSKPSSSKTQDSDDSDLEVKDLLQKSFNESDDDESFNSDEVDERESDEVEEESDAGEENEENEEDDSKEQEDDDSESDSHEEIEVVTTKNKSPLNGIPKATPNSKQKREEKKQGKEEKTPQKGAQTKKILHRGVIVEDLKEGQGPLAKNGKFVTVYYEGRLKQNNKLFDSTTKGAGFSFRLGSNEVIKGWDIGIQGMKVGGKRKITCPPAMAYGQKGSPPAIPANSTLVFEVELKKVR